MAVDLSLLGTPSEPFDFVVDPDAAKAYAAATNDPNPAYTSGALAPPIFAVVPVFAALSASAVGLIPAEMAMFIVHGEQDMHFHQPLKPGVTLTSTTMPFSVRGAGSGTRITIKTESADQATGAPVCTQFFTVFVRGLTGETDGGPDKPAHDFPDAARDLPVGKPYSIHVDDDQTFRYRDASGDMMPIHVDAEFAKQVGLPGIIAHGLCTMAMTSQAVIQEVCGGDPAKLKRLAVRMAANVVPGNDVEVQLYDAGATEAGVASFAFEATSAGATVIKNGLAEVG
jgi:acyl dehydratase